MRDIEKTTSSQQHQNGHRASFDNDDMMEEEEHIQMMDNKEQKKLRKRNLNGQKTKEPATDLESKQDEDEKMPNMGLIAKTDITSRVIFPLAYILFTVIYAVYYLRE